MSILKIPFDHQGAALKVKIEYQGLVAASYTYTLWETDSNDTVDFQKGNNQNPQDDEYKLPMPVSSNAGRLIDIYSAVKGLYDSDNEGNYKVVIKIFQGDKIIEKEVQPQPPQVIGNHVVPHQFYAMLI